MKYLVLDTSVVYDKDDGACNIFVIGIFDTVKDALSARANYYARYPDLGFRHLEICPLMPNKFYDDRQPVACEWNTEEFKASEEDLLYAISNITD